MLHVFRLVLRLDVAITYLERQFLLVFWIEDDVHHPGVCLNTLINGHFQPTKHDSHQPSYTRPANHIEIVAWLWAANQGEYFP
jgi:hypothetical protein